MDCLEVWKLDSSLQGKEANLPQELSGRMAAKSSPQGAHIMELCMPKVTEKTKQMAKSCGFVNVVFTFASRWSISGVFLPQPLAMVCL